MIRKIWIKNIKSFILLLLFLFLDVLGEIILALLFGQIIDGISSNLKNFNILFLKTGILILLTTVTFWLYHVYAKKFILTMSKDLKEEIFFNIQKESLQNFFSEDIGNKISLLTNDIVILETEYFQSVILLIRASLLFLFSIITLFSKSYQIGIFLLISGSISLSLPKILGKHLERYKKTFSDMQANYTSRISEYLHGFETIKSFDMGRIIKEKFSETVNNITIKGITYEKYYNLIRAVSILLGSITFMGSFLFGGYLASKGVITIGTMLTCVQLTNHITNPVYAMVDRISSLKSTKKILEKMEKRNFSKEEQEISVTHKNLTEEILFDNVSFGYSKEVKILDNINIKIRKNRKYLIVGKSGSGKTTFLKLLSKKILPDTGNIYIDNIKLKNLSEKSLLDLISYISQNVFLFKGSIFENITLYNDYSEETVKEILLKMGLEKFMKNLNTENFINENGNNLSGGEKQRFSIARALIKKSDIVIADEIFSSLDNDTAVKIEEELLKIDNITLVAVAHKLFEKNLKNYDEIIVLDKGKIVETGCFEKLIAIDSFFSKYIKREN